MISRRGPNMKVAYGTRAMLNVSFEGCIKLGRKENRILRKKSGKWRE